MKNFIMGLCILFSCHSFASVEQDSTIICEASCTVLTNGFPDGGKDFTRLHSSGTSANAVYTDLENKCEEFRLKMNREIQHLTDVTNLYVASISNTCYFQKQLQVK